MSLKATFQEKRIWPDRKRIAVKYWPEDRTEAKAEVALAEAGFIPKLIKWSYGVRSRNIIVANQVITAELSRHNNTVMLEP